MSVPADDLRRQTAQILGFARRGAKIDTVTGWAINRLMAQNVLIEKNGMISLKE